MKYTILLIKKSEGGIHVSVPALPDCTVEADTRDDAIRLAREAITEILSRSEIVQVDVTQLPKASTHEDIPWEWFGIAKDDATFLIDYRSAPQSFVPRRFCPSTQNFSFQASGLGIYLKLKPHELWGQLAN
jgi:predicted RNase H-like HicB family nuclease